MEPRIKVEDRPKVYDLMLNIESYLKKSDIPHSLLALLKVRASQINNCGYCLDMHHKDAVKAGENPQRLYLLPAWKESPVYSDEEKAALNLTETLTGITKNGPEQLDEAFAAMTKYYSKWQIADIV